MTGASGPRHQHTMSAASIASNASSTYSASSFQYHQRGDSQQFGRSSYYDDDHNGHWNDDSSPPTDCQWCDSCCACVSNTCGTVGVCGPRAAVLVLVTLSFWAVLWGFASSFPTEQDFPLTVGETWQVRAPPLWSRSSYEIHASSADPGLEVYEFAPVFQGEHAKCPVPSPENSKTLQHSNTFILQGDTYQYEYFHLNVGSKLSLDVLQRKGSTNIYLLQGYSTLKSLSEADSSSFQDFRAKSTIKRFSGQGGETTFDFDVTEADIYIIVYDNAAIFPEETKLFVQINIDMATHFLPVGKRVCDAKDTADGGCLWRMTADTDRKRVDNSCIIIKAVSSAFDDSERSIPTDDEDIVEVTLKARIGSLPLICLASIPVWIGILLLCREYGSDCIRRRRDPDVDGGDGDYYTKKNREGVHSSKKKNNNNNNYESVSTKDTDALNHKYMPALSESSNLTASSHEQDRSYQYSGGGGGGGGWTQ